jgi:abortive phage resistance protein AbiGi (putative antitoxin)
MHPPIEGRQPNEVLSGSPLVGGNRTPDLDDTEAAYWQGICFCDIPVTDLEIHMKKYSRVGLSFLKPFLVSKGANPVLYVANNSPALSFGLPGSRSGYDLWPRHRVFEGNIELFEDYRQKMHDNFPLTLDFFLNMLVFDTSEYSTFQDVCE